MIELIGLTLIIIGSFGLIRMPDVYTRIHASGLISYGIYILILSFGIGSPVILFSKSLILVGILFIVSPAINSLIAHAAHRSKVKHYMSGKK
ncbi:MAG: monovalent cation/H(+) antiporter subunit G [Candidatus Aenigmarchaeota archaeon]|nr:monovalent cation/H(+) antiporter subunit G [Candidatus Aenigmarchaeota archaeon]